MKALRVADGVAFVGTAEAVYVARVPEGPIHVLTDSAALIWHEALGVDRGTVASRVAAAAALSISDVAQGVDDLITALVRLGLLNEGTQVPD
ncbi:hypothetical protein [Raineyella antarctica]|uniref:hypothetical protein n=1 Tax=Raineyella antarctica TaxID=1577474 RepID=UPI000B83DF1D|nr:hypothetical protein [Raineyella antarctica]